MGEPYTGEACASKKAAEHAAARVAIAALFPDVPLQIQPTLDPRGKKRGREETSTAEDMEPKVKMVRFMQLVLGRSTTKTDLVYETVQDPTTKTYVTTLSLRHTVARCSRVTLAPRRRLPRPTPRPRAWRIWGTSSKPWKENTRRRKRRRTGKPWPP